MHNAIPLVLAALMALGIIVIGCFYLLSPEPAWYEQQGPAREVLVLGEMPDPRPAAGEVRIRIEASGINPGDIKKRQDSFGIGMAYPRVIPHSDGAGRVDQVGEGVASDLIGRAVWCYGAQSYRPFGTAAEFTVVPLDHVAPLPENISPEQGACLGIPGITAHRSHATIGRVWLSLAGDKKGCTENRSIPNGATELATRVFLVLFVLVTANLFRTPDSRVGPN